MASAAKYFYETYQEALNACLSYGSGSCQEYPATGEVKLKVYVSVRHEYRVASMWGGCPSGPVVRDTGECVDPPKTPGECQEIGELYDPATKQCVTQCQHGEFNGSCLLPPEPENECTKDSPDYRGEVVLGYGQSPIPACGDFDQCSGDTQGQVGFVNGELRCLPEDFGVPKCQGDSITVIDEYGFVCEPLANAPEEPETPEQPNTDTDGDGQPDEYDPDNDPNINRKQLDALNDKQQQANDSLSNLEGIGKGTNKRLDDIKQGVSDLVEMGQNGELGGGGGNSPGSGEGLQDGEGNDYLADIKQNTKDTADTLTELKDGPDDGYSTDGLGDAPTFAESSERLQLAITNNPTIAAVTTIPSVGSNNTCPVWTIPATDFWKAMPLDSHCQILTDHRGLLSMVFIAVWTLAAVFVFLRA